MMESNPIRLECLSVIPPSKVDAELGEFPSTPMRIEIRNPQ